MKKITYTFLLLMVLVNTIPAQGTINWDAVIDRYYEKYQPDVNPQWIFPIVFKNGIGKRDTIYRILDGNAHFGIPWSTDTVFGEMYQPVDSFGFSAFWADWPSTICDTLSVVKVNASDGGGGGFGFYNGIKPLTIYFNPELFYNDSLALLYYNNIQIFPPVPFEPLARGRLQLNDFDTTLPIPPIAESCNWSYNDIWISDSIPPTFQVSCYFSDSLVLQYDGDNPYVGELFFDIIDWEGVWVSTNEVSNEKFINIHPNPSSGELMIEIEDNSSEPIDLTLFDARGCVLLSEKVNSLNGSYILDLCAWDNGIYFIRVKIKEELYTQKISLFR